MVKAWTIKWIAVLLIVGWPTMVSAQEGTSTGALADADSVDSGSEASVSAEAASENREDALDASSEEEEKDSKGWGVNASAGVSLGMGAFVAAEYVRKVRSALSIGFGGNYTIPVVDVDVSVSTGFNQNLARGGGSQVPQEFRWSDSDLSLSRSIYVVPVADINISGSLGFAIPTSTSSRAEGFYTSIQPGLSFSGNAGPVGLSYSIGFYRNFHESTTPLYDPNELDVIFRQDGAEYVSSTQVAEGGYVNVAMGLTNNFNVSYKFLEDFNFGLGFGFGDTLTYDNGTITADDEYTSSYAKPGRGHGQSMNGSLSLSYKPWKFLGFSASMSSGQPWKTDDNEGYRFPFFDFESMASNRTKLRIGISGSY